MVEFIFYVLIYGVPIFIAIVLHEMAHGFAALLLGDDTAKRMNRFKLHTHFDLFGSLLLPVGLYILHFPFLFGYAKPVPVDARKFKDPLLDFSLVAIAGPLCNFLLAIISLLAINHVPSEICAHIIVMFAMTNLGLGFFNLIPIPPLDGSRIMLYLLPEHLATKYSELERFGIVIIFGLQLISEYVFGLLGIRGSFFYYCIEIPVRGVIRMVLGG